MPRSQSRALVLAALLATAYSATTPNYFQRDDVCGGTRGDSLSQCDGGLDDGLCCREGTTCINLAGGSTVLCCPDDACTRMKPITCNINAQDPAVNPAGILKTTALNSELPRCGDNCCPFGFSCNRQGECQMDEDQSKRPREIPGRDRPSSSSLPSSIPTPSLISSTTDSTTSPTSSNAPPSEEQQSDDSEDGGNNTLPTAIIVVSVLGGLLVLICLAVGVVMCLSRRKRKARMQPRHSSEKKPPVLGLCRASTSTSSFGNIISEPIPHQDSALRSDFILKTPDSGASRASHGMGSMHQGAGSSFSGTTATNNSPEYPGTGLALGSKNNPRIPARTLSNATMTTNNHSNLAIPPIRTMRNQQKPQINTSNAWTRHAAARAAVPDAATPVDPKGGPVTPRLQREPSSESINIFADPSTVGSDGSNPFTHGLAPPKPKRFTSGTTFTELMEEAQLGDVRRGDPFVPMPTATPPRR